MNSKEFRAESASTPTDADTHERSHPDLDAELSDEALEAAAGGGIVLADAPPNAEPSSLRRNNYY